LQGAAILTGANYAVPGWSWDYGDASTDQTFDLSHIYTVPGTYITNLTLSNALDTTGITLSTLTTVLGPTITSINIIPVSGNITTEITLNATVENATTYQWQSSSDNTTWSNITDATNIESIWTPGEIGVFYVRLMASDTNFSVYSDTEIVTIYAPPTISISISPIEGPITNTLNLSGIVTNPGPENLIYQWQSSTDNTTWSDLEGITTEDYIGSVTFLSTGTQYVRMLATGTGGIGTSNVVTYEAIPAPIFTSVTVTPSSGKIPLTISLAASASYATSYQWQILSGSTWTHIADTQIYTYTITTANTYNFRALATGAGGTTISSIIFVNAGEKPFISITEPSYISYYKPNESVALSALIVGADSFGWNFGDTTAVGDITANPTTVTYPNAGQKTITLTATNEFGSSSTSIIIHISPLSPRNTVTGPIPTVDASGIYDYMHYVDPDPETQQPDITNMIFGLTAPYTNLLGGMFFVFLFGVPYLIMWIRQKNLTIPSIIGVIFGSWMLVQLPAAYMLPAIGILALAIAGGIIGIVVKNSKTQQ
jgi:hypothetical protein